ncbi:superoxide dismutase family protein [Allosphingosinicella deserti]|uniref:Superoxide dismutase n=1 Tax=Allosphingosinicella deserti TaxID=2116704 RepID=A0A2P7QYG5_9SPHN|nr:superoxide dismutase family protein [Sphingomonas deserti]PSJ43011.1 superoxide dismutase [Sphingomonas deserti]
MKQGLWLALPLLALGACATNNGDGPAPGESAAAPAASAELRNPSGAGVARASVEGAGDSLRVRVEAAGLSQGAYGVHVHTTGACDAPAFTTAGPHWNPTGRQHGKDNPQGTHKGDLPNLLVGADGSGSIEYVIAGASLSGGANPLLDEDGAAIVVHQSADDYRTDPSGNSGNRIACGVLG